MSTARDEILGRIRSALGRNKLQSRIRADLDERLQQPPSYERPPVEEDLIRAFESRLASVHGGFHKVEQARLMEAIGECLAELGAERRVIAAPALEDLPWPEDWDVTFGASRGGDLVSVTPCFAAVAETGSVVLLSSPSSPTSLNFLPDLHIVLVRPDQLVRHVEDVWPKLRAVGGPPRAVNFITGPSKTADIEQTFQYGAHGPRSLNVIYISD